MRQGWFSRFLLMAGVFGLLSGLFPFPASGWAMETPGKPPIHVTLLQLNDVYQIAPVDNGEHGGLARVATLRKRILAENPHTFTVLAGDTLSPSIGSTLFRGKQMIDVWNQLGLDVATLGNHEFDFGNEVLLKRLQESRFQWVVANVRDQSTGQPFAALPSFVVREVEGVKIGFFGLITPDTEHSSHPSPSLQFKDPIYTACETITQMRQAGVDVIIAITHLPMGEDKRMAKSLNHQIALVMGGHEHTLLQSVAGGTPIFKVGSDARTLGRVDLYIDPETRHLESLDWQLLPVDRQVPEDPAVAETVKTYENQLNGQLGQVIGATSVKLDAIQNRNRSQETNLGNFLADSFRQKTGAEVALVNGGSIRSNALYGPGPLTRRDVMSVLPFANPIEKVAVRGAVLKQALENGVSRLGEEEAGRFPQISGLKLVYDPAKPVGNRVISVLINGTLLKPDKSYTLAVSSYLLGGGDDYAMLKGARSLLKPEEIFIDSDVAIEAIRQAQTIAPQVEGRIIRAGGSSKAAAGVKPGI